MTKNVDDIPGLKEDELVKLGNCQICGKKMLEGGGPTFYKVRLERAIWSPGAIQRRVGLELQLGSGALAQVMGPSEDLAKIYSGPHDVVVHESCAGKVHHLLELVPEAKEAEANDERESA